MRRVPGYHHSDIVRWFRTGWGFPELQFPVGFFLPQYLPVRGEMVFSELALVSGKGYANSYGI